MRILLAGIAFAGIIISTVAAPRSGGMRSPGSNPAAICFEDTASSAGISAQIVCGTPEKKWIMEANGSGCAWLDYDKDGWMDLLIVNGSSLERMRAIVAGDALPGSSAGVFLYRNLGNGRFQDVTARSGLVNPYWGTGANGVDFNND